MTIKTVTSYPPDTWEALPTGRSTTGTTTPRVAGTESSRDSDPWLCLTRKEICIIHGTPQMYYEGLVRLA